jgi:hypothetical protein
VSRAANPETTIRNLKRDLKRSREVANEMAATANTYRARATKAEQEVAEWKKRFDALLLRTPEEAR